MSVKLADTLAPMGDFPVAEADNVSIDINGTSKNLQQAYEDGDLGNGGGSSIQVDQMPAASATELGKVYQFIGASGTYQHNYFYECVSDGETPPTYSWVQKNVQPSNATASDVSYDNTTSELTATNVQDAVDEVVAGLGTASGKDSTDAVRPNSHDLVESGSVYSAINNALSAIYTPRGSLTCAELTSSLLIADNVGNVYEMSDSGTTSALFINGAGQTINAGDNVGIIKAGADSIMFNYMGNAFDLTDYQKKDLTTPVTIAGASKSTVEDAIGALNGLVPSNASANNTLITDNDVMLKSIDISPNGAAGKVVKLVFSVPSGEINGSLDIRDKSGNFWNVGFRSTIASPGSKIVSVTTGDIITDVKYKATSSTERVIYIAMSQWAQGIATVYISSSRKSTTITKSIIDSSDSEYTSASNVSWQMQKPTSSVTSGSTAPVTSGGVYNYVPVIENIVISSITMNANSTTTLNLSTYGINTHSKPWVAFIWNRSGFGQNMFVEGDGSNTLLIFNNNNEDITGNLQIAILHSPV